MGAGGRPGNPELWYVSASPSVRNAHSRGNAQAYLYRRSGAAHWEKLTGGLPKPLNSMPYALLGTGEWLVAGLADGLICASSDKARAGDCCT
jgi:hypothetical protein